ncbi:hypothetical protein LPB03_07695 [Polaribacter vadi]|uniref:Uncharacterized protein n=1 Tax=Polaribacter vadi TaxID=1774273 RepID=A0A1B8U354_9FLAO|nr:hypothetical protein [Polaribacter vadi]AOW17350.1 hypothetical protein LPB03_07695 [Polaribacter vadi]OBY66286.1 hypothetical protein LPB3_01080 [Polaribacter vadi]
MKYLATFLGTIVMFISTTNVDLNKIHTNNSIEIDEAVFDGNEGNLYFFTDTDEKAITIEDNENKLFKDFELAPNSYVGKTFELQIAPNKLKNNVCDSKAVIKITLKE